MQIALDGKTELAAYAGELGEAHVAEFRLAYAEIAESEGETVAGIELGEEPGALRIGGEEFDDWLEVEVRRRRATKNTMGSGDEASYELITNICCVVQNTLLNFESAEVSMEVVMRYGTVFSLALILSQLSNPVHGACSIAGSYAFVAQGLGSNASGKLKGNVALAGIFIFNPAQLVTAAPGATPVPAATTQGTVTRSFTLMGDGVLQGEFSGSKPTPDPGTVGTYTYGENGICSAKLSFPNTPLGTETYTIYITDPGDTIYFVNTTKGVSLTGRMDRR